MHRGGSSQLAAWAALAAAALALALGLQGCGLGNSTTPSPVPTPPPAPPPRIPWNLAPINITGQHLYDSKTGEQFHLKGIGFPNVGSDVDVNEWIRVLQRIKQLGPQINAIRIYDPPNCAVAQKAGCFEPFMRKADQLGVYVLIAGSGKTWGYFPDDEAMCKPATPQGCYESGNVLGYGRSVIRNFNFPNTLGIVIVNEMERNALGKSNILSLPALKAYARDLKSYMMMCNSESDSPTKGHMRQIPLVYAAIDSGAYLYDEADYLFCGAFNSSIDIFGLNVERWVSDVGGKQQYDIINSKVKDRHWPGAFIHTEEGGPLTGVFHRSWTQIPGFFKTWPSIDGFMAYTYNGATSFNMFDGPSADAEELIDGKVFFRHLHTIGKDPATVKPVVGKRPACQSSIIIDESGEKHPLIDFMSIASYATGKNGWAENCPAPWQAGDVTDVVV